jgi:hypothetical protein
MSTNYFYTLDVMDFQLRPKGEFSPGFFDAFDTIYIAGDHGGHFSHGAVFIQVNAYARLRARAHRLLCLSTLLYISPQMHPNRNQSTIDCTEKRSGRCFMHRITATVGRTAPDQKISDQTGQTSAPASGGKVQNFIPK